MSLDAVVGFLESAAENPSLQKRVKSAIIERADLAANELVEVAARRGFHFTATELRKALVDGLAALELSEHELGTVVGGATENQRVVAPILSSGGSAPRLNTTQPTTDSDTTSTGTTDSSTTSESR